jgi:hypothetical protein
MSRIFADGDPLIEVIRGTLVKRKNGSWYGVIVGDYETHRTDGVAVMSLLEFGAVHVEPKGNLLHWDGIFRLDENAVAIMNAWRKGGTPEEMTQMLLSIKQK